MWLFWMEGRKDRMWMWMWAFVVVVVVGKGGFGVEWSRVEYIML